MPRTGRPPRLIMDLCKRIRQDYTTSHAADTRLPREIDLAQQYNASRGSVRAALLELEQDRTIYRKANRGAYVAEKWPQYRLKYLGQQIAVVHFKKNYSSPFMDSFNTQAMSGINRAISPLGINAVIVGHNIRGMKENYETLADHLVKEPIVGAIFLGPQPDIVCNQIPALPIPTCSLDWDATSLGIDSVCFNNRDTGAATVRRLIRLGHRRFVLIGESPEKNPSRRDAAWQERQTGMLEAFGKQPHATLDLIYNQTRDSLLIEAGETLLKLLRKPAHLRPTAIVMPTGELLHSWHRIAKKAGLVIPRDLSIMSFGGVQTSKMSGHEFDGQNLGYAAGFHITTRLREPREQGQPPKMIIVKGFYRAGTSLAHAPKN